MSRIKMNQLTGTVTKLNVESIKEQRRWSDKVIIGIERVLNHTIQHKILKITIRKNPKYYLKY